MSDDVVSYESVKHYLENYITKAAKTYNTQITSLRRSIRDFLRLLDLIMSFKMASVDEWQFVRELPSKNRFELGFKEEPRGQYWLSIILEKGCKG